MALRRHRRSRRSGSSRRKIQWAEANVGAVSGALPNTDVVTGWAAFPAGQYDFQFTPPAFQPEDLTLVRSICWPAVTLPASAPTSGSTFSFAFGLIAWDAQDGNAY